MEQSVRITYLGHSAFALQLNGRLLVFDDARGVPPEGASLAAGYITRALIAASARAAVFISHGHGDHFDPHVYTLRDAGAVSYFISDDLAPEYEGLRMLPGDVLQHEGMTVRAFGSTDLGVSFLVEVDGYRIFHAGDLNLWHWRDESTLREIAMAEEAFDEALAPIQQHEVDIAFFPVDPRQGSLYDAGALLFAARVAPKLMIPMHFQGRRDVAVDFARRNRTRKLAIVALTTPGEAIAAVWGADGKLLLSGRAVESLGERVDMRDAVWDVLPDRVQAWEAPEAEAPEPDGCVQAEDVSSTEAADALPPSGDEPDAVREETPHEAPVEPQAPEDVCDYE